MPKWLPSVGLTVAAGLVGGALGPLGALGTQETNELVAAPAGVLAETTPAYLCAGGAAIGTLSAGERVLTVARSEDSSWLGVRNPDSLVDTIWLSASVVTIDAGQDAAGLPTGGQCPVVTARTDQPAAPAPGQDPGSARPRPRPGPDTRYNRPVYFGRIVLAAAGVRKLWKLFRGEFFGDRHRHRQRRDCERLWECEHRRSIGFTLEFLGLQLRVRVLRAVSVRPQQDRDGHVHSQDSSGNQASAPRTLVFASSESCVG